MIRCPNCGAEYNDNTWFCVKCGTMLDAEKDKVVELVILVKVKISEPTTLQRAADIRLQRFVPDPRPF